MSTTYEAREAITFEGISRRVYGTEANANLIREANPDVVEPIRAGTILTVPSITTAAPSTLNLASNDVDEVSVLIDGNRFRFWSEIVINTAIDAVDTVEFSAPFEQNAPDFRETFRPFTYKTATVIVGNKLLFTGTIVGINPVVQPASKTIEVSAYSLAGVLGDCTASIETFPAEFNNQNLKQIANKLASPFGIPVEFEADAGAVFDRVALNADVRVMAFLAKLAKQRNRVISSNEQGALVFLQSAETGSPVAKLRQGESPLISVTPLFSPQEYYSHVSGIEPVVLGREGSRYTVKNPRLTGVLRPITFTANDTLGGDLKTAAEAKLGRMYGGMASYAVTVSTWRDSNDELWKKNTTLTLQAADAMVYNEFEFEIRNVQFRASAGKRTATLNLVIPGAYSGAIAEALPWDG